MPEKNRDNIRRTFDKVDRIDYHEGKCAFRRYRQTQRELAEQYGVRLSQAVAVFCALSPNNDYIKNLRSAATVLWGFRNGHDVDDLVVTTYGACKYRAWSYLHDKRFLNVVRGPKIRSFYKNILWPNNPTEITIDGHMVNIWFGKRHTLKQVVYMRREWSYNAVADDYRRVADELDLLPSQLQAMLWFTWKRIHAIEFDPQLNLFNRANQWRTYIPAAMVQPYPLKSITARQRQEQEHEKRQRKARRLRIYDANAFTFVE